MSDPLFSTDDDKVEAALQALRCATCGGHIPPGQRYHDGRYVTDDRPWTCREHAFCHEVYWVIHRYLGLYDDEVVAWDSVREVMAGLVCFMVRPTS